jgi:MFS family permease
MTSNATARRIGGLLWHRDFALLWTGETTRQFGIAVTTVAMPLIAVTVLHAGAFVVGVLTAAAWLPWLLIGLPAGAWVDRLPRKPVLVICDAASTVLLASVPIAGWLGVLGMAQLLVVTLLVGVGSVFFSTAHQVYLPATVPDRTDLPEAGAKSEGSEAAARVAGPGLAGLLAQLFGATAALAVDAVGSVISAACILAVRAEDPRPPRTERPAGLLTEIGEGLRYLATDPYLLPINAYAVAASLVYGALQALVVLFLVRAVGVDAATVGAMIGITGAGGVTGALVVGRIIRKLGTARTLLLSECCAMPFGLLIPLTSRGAGLSLFVVGMVVLDLGFTVSSVVMVSFRQSYVPRELLGRVTASARSLAYGAIALGGLLAGSLATVAGPLAAMWVVTGAQVVFVTILLVGPIRRHRDLPATGRLAVSQS